MVVHNRFTNPANGAEYTWQINHDEEGESGRDRSVDSSQVTAGVRTIQTQGDLTPIVLQFSGQILQGEQLAAMIDWQNLCETQTIVLTDMAGDSYEGLISSFKYKRVRVAFNSRQPAAPWKWTYTLNFTVVRVLAGLLGGSPA